MNPIHTDVLIVGAGPAGLFAAFQCGMLGLKSHLVDARDSVGGQCAALYPEKPIYDIPAYPRISGAQLVAQLMAQCAPFEPGFHLGEQPTRLTRAGERWHAGLSSGASIDCGAVILATGAGRLRPHRPAWPGLERFEGRGIQYSAGRIESFRGRHVAIAGGGDSAADWAVQLAEVAATVHLIHRRERFRAAPESQRRIRELVAAGRIRLWAPAEVAGLDGAGSGLERIAVKTASHTEWLACDDLLPFFGLTADPGPLADWGLQLEQGRVRIDARTCATNLPGVFAVGDAAHYPGKLKLILTGFAEAATAAHGAWTRCRPGQAPSHEHSTQRGLPAATT